MSTPPGPSGDSYPSDPQQPGYGPGDTGGSYPPPGGYGGPPPDGGYPPAPGGYGQPRRNHPRATTSLVLGIVGLVCCSVAAPFAWVIGKKAVREIDQQPGLYDGRGQAQAGYILGIIGTVLLVLGVIVFVFAIAVGGFAFEFESGTTSP